MTRYVIDPDVALRLARDEAVIAEGHQLLAPTLPRSHLLSLLYQAVRRGELTRKEAALQLCTRTADPVARRPGRPVLSPHAS